MSLHLFSGSEGDRVATCPASAVMPHAKKGGAYAVEGTQIHEILEIAGTRPEDVQAALDCLPDKVKERAGNIDLEAIFADYQSWRCEVAMAWNFRTWTARELGAGMGRKYDVTEDEIPLTLDIFGLTKYGVWRVEDYKTGLNLGSVKSLWQMRLGVLCVASLVGLEPGASIEVQITYIEQDGKRVPKLAVFTYEELKEVAVELDGVIGKIVAARDDYANGREPTLYPGDCCRYCPSFFACPYNTALVKAAVNTDLETVVSRSAELTDEELAAVWLRVKQLDAVSKHIKDVIKTRVSAHPIPSQPGKHLVMYTQSYSYFDQRGAIGKLKKLGVSDEEIAGLVLKGSKEPWVREMNIEPGKRLTKPAVAPKLAAPAEPKLLPAKEGSK